MVTLIQSRKPSSGYGTAEPKYMTPRTPSRPTRGHEVARIAEALGQPFMPWQQHWALVVGEMVQDEETGIWVPAYPEAFATVMRQQGKTLWVLSEELHRAILHQAYDGKPQAIAYSGQSGSMARQKFRKEHWPMIHASPTIRRLVKRPRFAAEDTGIDFKTGAILTIWSTAAESGHSLTVDLVCMDEIWADTDDRREQAARPAMATRHDSQKLLASTAGTEKSTFYLRKQAAGRAAVTEGRTEGMAYLEFAFAEDDDPEDPRTWWANMPALGYTISERTVQAALEEMRGEDGDLSEFKRAWGNVTARTGGARVIPEAMWLAVCDPDAAPAGRLVIAADAAPDQSSASIAVVDHELTCELIDNRDGTGWVLDRLEALHYRWQADVVLDVGGPLGYLASQLEQRGVTVAKFNTREVTHSAAAFMERLADRRLTIRPHQKLNAAAEGAIKRPVGDGWTWSRKSTTADISPLVAVTLGVGWHLLSAPEDDLVAILV